MPKCDGRPDGPCPKAKNDSSVRGSQGDLMLCHDCEMYRFPKLNKGRTAKQTGPSSRKGTVKTESHDSPSGSSVATDTAESSTHEVRDVKCCGCDKISDRSTIVKCDVCKDIYDQQCSTLPKEVFETLLTIVQFTGWVCYNCRSSIRTNMEKLYANQSSATDEIAKLSTSVEYLRCKVNAVETELNNMSSTVTQHATSAARPDTTIKSCIAKVVQDINRRDSNVIVVGFPEQENESDEEAFSAFCETNLTIKPVLIGCRRIGSPSTQRPRHLLLRLRSAQSAQDLRFAARLLRRSTDNNIKNIYINADLTPEQAQLAYEERQRRRARRQQQTDSVAQGTDQQNNQQPFQ